MRRYLLLSLAALMTLALMACNRDTPETPDPSEPDNPVTEPGDTIPPVADAALYRGIVTAIDTDGDTPIVSLRQAAGTNFGADTLNVRMDAASVINFAMEDLEVGNYIEIQYGRALGGDMPDEAIAITAQKLPDAEDCILNGTLREITYENDTEGVMIIEPMGDTGGNNVSIAFNNNGFTQFYLTVADLAEGDTLNIYTDGEGYAYEVRRYTSA